MKDKELIDLWRSQDAKLDEILRLNRQRTVELTRDKLARTIGRLRTPKIILLLIGIPYVALLWFLVFVGVKAGGVFFVGGFAGIALIMSVVVATYAYQLALIAAVNRSESIVAVQTETARLKVASFNTVRLSILQIPLWSLCWISVDALRESWLLYGGVNLLVFLGLAYLTYWLWQRMDLNHPDDRVRRFFLSGPEWKPLEQATTLLSELAGYRKA
jgi:hypothetical protein